MRTKKLMDRKQDTSSMRPEWAGGDLLSGLIKHFASSNSGFFFVCCCFLFTDSNCLPGSSLLFYLMASHPPSRQRHFGVPVLKHR